MATEKQRQEEEIRNAPNVDPAEVPESVRIEAGPTFLQHLTVPLTEEELLDKGRMLSEKYRQLNSVQNEKAQANRDFAEQTKTLTGSIADLSLAISTQKEKRPVECQERKDFLRGECFTIRLDTHETIATRKLREDEKQPGLF